MSGPYVTLALLAAVELLHRMVPDFPNPAPLLLLAVMYSAFSGGWPAGLLSGMLAIAYFPWFMAAPGQPAGWAPGVLHEWLLLVAAVPLMVGSVEVLKRNAERAMELQVANARLRELDALKTQFLNNAAHELRTPLTPIKTQMHLLKANAAEGLSDRQRSALRMIDRNIERLNALVQDLLEVARLQAGRLQVRMEPTPLELVVEEAAESFHDSAREAGVDLQVRALQPAEVRGDAQRLLQVLFNLLSNALKFTPAGGRIEVALEARAGEAVVVVRDTGLGIRPQDLPRLFQPFSTVHDPSKVQAPSSGLGLYICKGIVEQHGGRLWAHSDGLGQGSTFGVAIPLAAATRPVQPARDAGLARGRGNGHGPGNGNGRGPAHGHGAPGIQAGAGAAAHAGAKR